MVLGGGDQSRWAHLPVLGDAAQDQFGGGYNGG